MSIYEIAALAAALCWAITGVITAGPAQHLGALAFTRIRMTMVLAMLAAFVAWTGSWRSIGSDTLPPLVASGVIGIFIGDSVLFATMNRLGPRRTSILFSLNAPLAVILGWLVLGERLSGRELAGIALAFSGVLLAILFGKRKSQLHQWESVKGPLWIGVALGMTAALAQAGGSLIARPVMETGIDPAAGSLVRVATSVACFYMAILSPGGHLKAQNEMTLKIAGVTAFSGFLAMAVGMTLVLFALRGGEVGIVSTLSATTPALILPLLWIKTGEAPAPAAWLGALLVIAGSALLFAS
jgi:drug/metabolite transporter (DMT)-like permease